LLVLGFAGFPGSGKSEATAIAHAQGFRVIAMGDMVRTYMRQRGIGLSEHNVGHVATTLRRQRGMDIIAKMCIPAIYANPSEKVVIDGIRGIAEVNAYKKEFNDRFKLIAIAASSDARFERVRNRSRSDDTPDFESFRQKDDRELAWGLKEALDSADVCISNEGTLQEFNSAVRRVLERLVAGMKSAIEIRIWTPIHETEWVSKVEAAVLSVFPDAALQRSDRLITGTSTSLETFAKLLKSQRIRSTARTELLKGLASTSFEFSLNKQVATIGKVNFGPGPLGSIHVKVVTRSPEDVINEITNTSKR